MSLAEFNKKTPVNMAIPRGGGITGTEWDRMDLNLHKDPAQQAKSFKKVVAEDQPAAAQHTEPVLSQKAPAQNQKKSKQFGDFATLSE